MGRAWEGPGNRGGAIGGTGEPQEKGTGEWHLEEGEAPGAVLRAPEEQPSGPGQLIMIVEDKETGGVPNNWSSRYRIRGG